MDRLEFWSPAYAAKDYGIQLPASLMQADSTEVDLPNVLNVEAVYLHAFISGSWVSHLVPGSAVTIQPGVGVFIAGTFPQTIPATTRMMVSTASNVAAGGSMISSTIPSSTTGRLEGSRVGSTSQLPQASGTAALTGTDGRIGGASYNPSYIVMKPVAPLDRPVFCAHFGSIGDGKNEMENVSIAPYLAGGFLGRALDDDTRSRRMPYCYTGIPGTSATKQQTRPAWARTLDRIRQCPNRPYTHVVTEHYNNDGFTDAGYRDRANAYYNVLQAETRAWGNAAAPIYQTRCIPRAGSTNFATSLAGQTGAAALTDTKWQFDADVLTGFFPQLAGSINVNRDFAYDQDANRGKVKTLAFSTTVTAAYTSGQSQITLNDPVDPEDFIVLDPDGSPRGTHVRSCSGSAGAYVATLTSSMNVSAAVDATVKKSIMGDSVGLHPSTPGHKLISAAVIDWKNALFG